MVVQPLATEIKKIAEKIQQYSPLETAENWDPIGLVLGNIKGLTKGVVISVDFTREVLDLAVSRGYRLIVTHHPPIFPKAAPIGGLLLEKPDFKNSRNQLILEAIRKGISLYVCHTNFDQGSLEVANEVSRGLKFDPQGKLMESHQKDLLKLAVFVPKTHRDQVLSAICEAGAGNIGNYDHCTFSSMGMGTFRGNIKTNPFIGKAGNLEKAEEYRLETILPVGLKNKVLAALRNSHPYEEIAYDLYPLAQSIYPTAPLIRGMGYGVWGNFSKKLSFSEVARRVKQTFKLKGFWVSDPLPKKVTRVAFVPGKGASFVSAAQALGCELLVTGEVGYHAMLESSRSGMAIIEMGHKESEIFFPQVINRWLKELKLPTAVVHRPSQQWY